jgi:hypothetical protein
MNSQACIGVASRRVSALPKSLVASFAVVIEEEEAILLKI